MLKIGRPLFLYFNLKQNETKKKTKQTRMEMKQLDNFLSNLRQTNYKSGGSQLSLKDKLWDLSFHTQLVRIEAF